MNTTQKLENDKFIWPQAFVIQIMCVWVMTEFILPVTDICYRKLSYVVQIDSIKQMIKGCFIAEIIGWP